MVRVLPPDLKGSIMYGRQGTIQNAYQTAAEEHNCK